MMGIEDRMRDTLHQLADTVAPSPHARADFERRLARRRATRWRMPVLATAAAALAVVAGVAVPMAMNRSDGPQRQGVATAPPTSAPTSVSDPTQVRIGTIAVDGVEKDVFFETRTSNVWCVVVSEDPQAPSCETAPNWPTEPDGRHAYVTSRQVLGGNAPDTGPLPNLLLFVTAPTITTLDVRDGPGQPVAVRPIADTDGARYYLADFGGSSQGFGFDAKDAQGRIVESAIT